MTEPVVVKLSTRRDAKKYRVTYTDAGPRMVEVWEPTRSYNSHYVWKAIWNSAPSVPPPY